jgi:formamidopyrimidine-DNA glycosylase
MNLELHVHHFVPLSEGGSNDPTNLTTICADCHRRMHENHYGEREEGVSSGFFCLNCDRFYSVDYGRKHQRCDVCGTILRSWFVDKKD